MLRKGDVGNEKKAAAQAFDSDHGGAYSVFLQQRCFGGGFGAGTNY
ncbi:hypothetical protein ASZ90_018507 [hydrocarbon metagenome]|uniref:Uncharacterized protein n=1 Tax=hydrocarbon metagenome TaxID=938273 RepID=A0A0W8E6K6_9ZZZZ